MSLLARLEKQKDRVEPKQQSRTSGTKPADPLVILKGKIHEQLVSEIDSKLLKNADQEDQNQELKEKVGHRESSAFKSNYR